MVALGVGFGDPTPQEFAGCPKFPEGTQHRRLTKQ